MQKKKLFQNSLVSGGEQCTAECPEEVGEGGRLFSRLHRVELDEDNLDVDFVLDSLAR